MANNQLYVTAGGITYIAGDLDPSGSRLVLYTAEADAFMSGSELGRAIDTAIGQLMEDRGLTCLHIFRWSSRAQRISVRYR